ncbi:MAG: T9SS type A sorting domain-containing protein, partial [Muribaculaceae bacterium]|nr:T9SS type A sorting domain-containing protein [Muribaculaceae bacterium]
AEGSLQGTWFDFTDLPSVSDEFFIVIDGLPESRDDFEGVAFGMAGWRPEGNTALLEIDGQWREVNDYFGADKCTSYLIRPVIRHSVITSLPVGDDIVLFDKDGGETAHTIFSYMGREENVACDADWCRVTSAPGEYTIDELTIACDPNPTNADREAHLTISDGVGTHVLTVKQSFLSGINLTETPATEVTAYPSLFSSSFTVKFPAGSSLIQVVDLNGRLVLSQKADPTATSAVVDGSSWATGVYIVLIDDKPVKVAKK